MVSHWPMTSPASVRASRVSPWDVKRHACRAGRGGCALPAAAGLTATSCAVNAVVWSPGATLTVELKNEGKVPHTFTIDSLHIDQQLNPDQKKTVTVKLPSSGTVAFYCRFHKSLGMQGAFFFNAGDTVAGAGGSSSGGAGGGSSSSSSSTGGYNYN